MRGGVAGFETDVREGPIFHAIEKELGGGALFRYVDACVEIKILRSHQKRLSEELSGAPDALVDFHTGRRRRAVQ